MSSPRDEITPADAAAANSTSGAGSGLESKPDDNVGSSGENIKFENDSDSADDEELDYCIYGNLQDEPENHKERKKELLKLSRLEKSNIPEFLRNLYANKGSRELAFAECFLGRILSEVHGNNTKSIVYKIAPYATLKIN
jgi:hypothetical protein